MKYLQPEIDQEATLLSVLEAAGIYSYKEINIEFDSALESHF